ESWLSLLRCPDCGGRLHSAQPEFLRCSSCEQRVTVVGGIPRFAAPPEDPIARRTQASFGYEWTHFHDWAVSGATNFRDYFGGIDLAELRGHQVLDAGCGSGRHAAQLAPFVERLVAVDFSIAIDVAARNTSGASNVLCIQADLTRLPLADESFDF